MTSQQPPETGDSAGDQAELTRALQALTARGPGRMVPDLSRITALMDTLGSPQRAYPSIHLTGTNGKTSTARMVDSLLRALGLRTGRYTSPHLASPTERLSLDGAPVDARTFAAAYDDIAPYLDVVDARSAETGGDPLTYFEVMTAMAYAAFADAPVDVAVIEVGMGGRWDATNVLEAGVCVLTPIAVDHPELGATPAEVASEKVGIIHPGALVVTAVQELEVAEKIVARVAEVGAVLAREGLEFGVVDRQVAVGGQLLTLRGLGGVYDDVLLPLHGAHQAQNASLALAAVEAFVGGGQAGLLDVDAVRQGFAEATSPGRMETVRTGPLVLLDGAHNPAGARALAVAFDEAFTVGRVIGVLGVLADKDAVGILEALEPVLDELVVTRSSSPRALDVDTLADLALGLFGESRVTVVPRLDDALDTAVALADADPEPAAVLVTGSLTVVGEARTLLGGEPE